MACLPINDVPVPSPENWTMANIEKALLDPKLVWFEDRNWLVPFDEIAGSDAKVALSGLLAFDVCVALKLLPE